MKGLQPKSSSADLMFLNKHCFCQLTAISLPNGVGYSDSEAEVLKRLIQFFYSIDFATTFELILEK